MVAKKGGGLPPQLRAAAVNLAKDKTEAAMPTSKKSPFKSKKVPPFMAAK